MTRPTIALAMIVKNEAHNLPQLFESIKDCFDEIHITDTGSTDDTVKIAEEHGAIVHHFEWIDDFAAARNYSFQFPKTDFIMWMDGDDVLENREAFIAWRDNALEGADYWLATYHYSSRAEDNYSLCSFARERVVRRVKELKWSYFVHEGIMPKSAVSDVRGAYATTWAIRHKRTEVDLKADRSRNLRLFDKHKDNLDARMKFYYGKEIFESGDHVDAIRWLMDAATDETLEIHDRILSLQYAVYCYMKCEQYAKAIQIAFQGVQLEPNRAEFYCLIGDAYIKQNQFAKARPFYEAAKACVNSNDAAKNQTGAIFSHDHCYGTYPRNQITRLYVQSNCFDAALKEAQETVDKYNDPEAKSLLEQIIKILESSKVDQATEQTDDLVFTTPPVQLYPWDPKIAKEKGVGGSETACVQMAYWLKKHAPNRRVIVFNPREQRDEFDGVEYRPLAELPAYMNKYVPAAHVAWRHNVELTKAPTYVWCHDLITPNMQSTERYEKVLCLSEFHKRYVNAMTGVPFEKVHVTRNGIDPTRFEGHTPDKIRGRIVYSSSPDRGLDKAIRVMDKVVQDIPEAELHVFYGFSNMEKMGMHNEVSALKKMIEERPYVKFVGNVDQERLRDEFMKAEVWLYPTHFQETFCITALEALACSVFPVTRRFGALQDTLAKAEKEGMAYLADFPYDTESQGEAYAAEVVKAINERRWENVKINLSDYSWESVAKEWAEWLFQPR